jgi:hypothetical protein
MMKIPAELLSAARGGFADEIEALACAVDATRRDAGFARALETMALFWNYSWFNRWWIQVQRPTATRVAGRRTWQRLGRTVKPGERPIWVAAPTRDGFPFLAVPVFDQAQTRGRRLARLPGLPRGRTRYLRALEAAAARLGIEVGVLTRPDLDGCSYGGRILIRAGLSPRARTAVLAHELAHELLHQQRAARRRPPRLPYAQREAEAEATAYVLLRALGLPSPAPSYIAWQGGDGAMIRRSMARIQRAAREVLAAASGEGRPRRGARPRDAAEGAGRRRGRPACASRRRREEATAGRPWSTIGPSADGTGAEGRSAP